LRWRLGLDSGYLSRLIQRLQAEGLVSVEEAESDARVRVLRLTRAGETERELLDRLSNDLARSFLDPLDGPQRARLVEAVGTVEQLLTAGLVEIHHEDPRSQAARFCFGEYFRELDERFTGGFDPALSISADPDELTEPRGILLVARLRALPIGCGALKLHGRDPAELKRMWVSPDARGLGLGRRILGELENEARSRGVTILRLETNRSLVEAIRLYRSVGFEEVGPFNDEPFADHWFEKRLSPGRSRRGTGR
jgi:GNAT superfamily N-acetyltransferase